MATKCFVLMTACLALCNGAMVRREAGEPASGGALQDLQKHAAEFQKTFKEQFNAIVNTQNTHELSDVLQEEGTASVLRQLSALSNSLQGALGDANGKAREALEQTRQNLQGTAEELRKTHPDVEKQAIALREQLQTAVQNTVQETQKLATEVSKNVEETNQKLAPKIKAAYDDFVKHAAEVQKKVIEAANKQ